MDRRIARSKRSIRAALVELIRTKPVEQITVTEISRLADVDRKTFYSYYGTVMDVYWEIEREISDEIARLLREVEPLDFERFFAGLTAILEKDYEFYLITAKRGGHAFLYVECIELLADRLISRFTPPNAPLDTERETALRYAAAGIIGTYSDWLRRERNVSLDELTHGLSRAFAVTVEGLGLAAEA